MPSKTKFALACVICANLFCLAGPPLARADSPAPVWSRPAAFVPDSATVQRFGKGYRYAQQGWIVLHLEGSPYERGVQHGRLLAPEIAGYLRCYATVQSPEAGTESWNLTRTIVNTAFLRGFDREYLEEMKGIADGATAAGARFDDRALDLIDVAALNLWPEIMTLDEANDANPTGLEGVVFPDAAPTRAKSPPEGHCSAFAATGKATRDGHAIIGHITMFGLYPSRWFNVWLDIQPDHGHRLTMQSYPAGIYSGMDYYLNDAGIALVETTIDQSRFNSAGKPLASRARKAMQYSDSIEAVVEALQDGNNGLYNNEWLLADMKTDEIAMFELGTRAGKLWRSSRQEWYGGTEGFYWGCNNPKDLAVRLETIPAVTDRPANLVWRPADRDRKWLELYNANVGKMDESFAQKAFTTPPLCSSSSLDVKFTTAALAKYQQSWAIFGPPRGHTWLPTAEEAHKFKDIRPLVSNPWTMLGPAKAPNGPVDLVDSAPTHPVDINDPTGEHVVAGLFSAPKDKDDVLPPTKPAWHGTLLPGKDEDLWLASSFADYERLVSLEQGYAAAQPAKCLCTADYDKVAESLFAARARYFGGVRLNGDVPLTRLQRDVASDAWYKIASGKGVLVLAELRRLIGNSAFEQMMDEFGRAHAGRAATTAEFVAHASRSTGRDLTAFFNYWLNETGLPRIELVSASLSDNKVTGVLRATGGPLPANIEMTVEQGESETTRIVDLASDGAFEITSPKPAVRLVVDKYARAARANGSEADLGSFAAEPDRTLIVYGERSDAAANHEAAETCQKAIRASWFNIDVPIKSDAEVTDDELKSHHLILIGRPAANSVTERVSKVLPVRFGTASFTVRDQTYANADSTVLVAAVSLFNARWSVAVIAGNSAAATLAHAGELGGRGERSEVKVFDAAGKAKSLVAPAPELTKSFEAGKIAASVASPK